MLFKAMCVLGIGVRLGVRQDAWLMGGLSHGWMDGLVDGWTAGWRDEWKVVSVDMKEIKNSGGKVNIKK